MSDETDEDPVVSALARSARLPSSAIESLFARYGRPLDQSSPTLDPILLLDDGVSRLGRLRHRAPVDVIENDYFVLEGEGRQPSAMPGPLFAAALAALTRRPSG